MIRLTPRRVLLGILLLFAVGLGIERLVISDREAIESLLERAATSVSRDDWDALANALDEEYAEHGRDKQAFVAFVRGLKERHRPQGVGLEIGDTTVDGDRAETRVVVKPGAPYIGLRIGGRVVLVRSPDGWRIRGVTEEETNFLGR